MFSRNMYNMTLYVYTTVTKQTLLKLAYLVLIIMQKNIICYGVVVIRIRGQLVTT